MTWQTTLYGPWYKAVDLCVFHILFHQSCHLLQSFSNHQYIRNNTLPNLFICYTAPTQHIQRSSDGTSIHQFEWGVPSLYCQTHLVFLKSSSFSMVSFNCFCFWALVITDSASLDSDTSVINYLSVGTLVTALTWVMLPPTSMSTRVSGYRTTSLTQLVRTYFWLTKILT